MCGGESTLHVAPCQSGSKMFLFRRTLIAFRSSTLSLVPPPQLRIEGTKGELDDWNASPPSFGSRFPEELFDRDYPPLERWLLD